MRRLKLTLEYDGTDFAGWQRQETGPSVQAALEAAISRMTGKPTALRGAGRTDAGVHARGQVAHFDTDGAIPPHGFLRGLNTYLPRAIAVTAVEEVPPGFDARFSAVSKLYRYRVWNAPARSALEDRFTWQRASRLDVERMRAAARPLVGRHDFAAFRAADCERRTTVRTVHRLDVTRAGALLEIDVEADAFLKNMVRILAGTLVEAGRGALAPEAIAGLLEGRDRRLVGPTAPARGLTLVRVRY